MRGKWDLVTERQMYEPDVNVISLQEAPVSWRMVQITDTKEERIIYYITAINASVVKGAWRSRQPRIGF